MSLLDISLFFGLIISGIVIHITTGRISRNRYIKVHLMSFVIIIIYAILSYTLFPKYNLQYLTLLGIIAIVIYSFKLQQFTIRRLHDINLSGWYSLISFIPLGNLILFVLCYVKKRDKLLNEYDTSMDYLKFIKQEGLFPEINLIEISGKDFIINGILFRYKEYGDHAQYEVSSTALEIEDHSLFEYCKNNLNQVENNSEYAEKYKMSFLVDSYLFQKIKTDLHAIVINAGYMLIGNRKVFIRTNCGSYEIVYNKNISNNEIPKFSEIETIGDYSCQNLTVHQLEEFIKQASCF